MSKRRQEWRWLCAGMLTWVFAVCPLAQGQSATAQQDLYLDAMKSISEGRQQDADDALNRMIEQEPQHAGAWLDLAIIQCELGHAAEAERLFTIIESRFSPPPGILEVIAGHRLNGCKGRQPHNKLSVLLGRGFDSNVNQGASSSLFSLGSGSSQIVEVLLPQYLPEHDQYTLLSTEYIRDLSPNGAIAYAQLQARENDTLTQYNTVSALLGVDHPWRIGDWGLRTTGSVGFLTLGDQLYQRQAQLQARIFPPLGLPEHFQLDVLTGLSYVQYTTLDNFNSATDELSAQLAYQGEKTQAQFNLGLLFDHGDAARLGGDRNGWLASALVHTRINEHVGVELGWTLQDWNSQSPYSPGLIDQTRRQDTRIARAGLIVPINPDESLHIEWRQVRNNENISLFQYNGQILQISMQWQNF
jgi:hypothetical protein